MEVNAVAASAAKTPAPLILPIDPVGGAFADFLHTTTTTPAAAQGNADQQGATPTPSTPNPPAESRKSNASTPPGPQSQRLPLPHDTSSNAPARSTGPATNRSKDQSTSADQQPADQQSPATTDGKSPVATIISTKPGASGGQPAGGDKPAVGDPAPQNPAIALLALLTAASGQVPVTSQVPVATGGSAEQSAQTGSVAGLVGSNGTLATPGTPATAGTTQTEAPSTPASNTLAAALFSQASTPTASSKQVSAATLLPGFKEAFAQPTLPTPASSGAPNPLADLLAGHGNGSANGQISVVATAAGGLPQPLLTGTVLAATGALSNPTPQVPASSVQQLQSTGVEQNLLENLPVVTATSATVQTAESASQGLPSQTEITGTPFVAVPGVASAGAPSAPSTAAVNQPILLHPPAEQIAVRIAKAIDDGVDRIRIQLDPADLGRVEVKMDVGHDGRVLAVITAERPQTLDMLQRDAAGLQRALQDAGLNADGQSLSFSLRGNGGQAQSGGEQNPSNGSRTPASDTPVQIPTRSVGNPADVSGLDIRV